MSQLQHHYCLPCCELFVWWKKQDSNLLSVNATGLQPAPALPLRRSSVHLLASNRSRGNSVRGQPSRRWGKILFEKCSRRDSNPHCP